MAILAELGQDQPEAAYDGKGLPSSLGQRQKAIASFTKKLLVVIFTPFDRDRTKQIAYASDMGVPDISFRYEDIVRNFEGLEWRMETLETDTQYRTETVFYVKKPPPSSP